MQIDPNIFKAYDIRGMYPQQINEDAAEAIARAYATFLLGNADFKRDSKIAVGSDMRLSSPALKARVIEALLDSGINIEDVGLLSTPSFYFAVANFGYEGGLQITASHNPKDWNGIKIVRRNAVPVSKDSGILEIKEIIEKNAFAKSAEQKGQLTQRGSILEAEVADQIKYADLSKIKPFKIAIDAANGMASTDLEALFAKLNCQLVKMNFEPDGSFPAHEADPMIEKNTLALREKIVAEKCDLGIAPDGDGDRYFFFDEKGELVPQAVLRGIMAQIELCLNPNAVVAYDIRPGRITKDMIDELHGKAVISPVGHSLIKELMIKENAVFGGESSGHYFYKLPYGTFEAPMILVLKFLQFVSEQNKPLFEIVAPLKRYANSGEINIKLADKQQAAAKIEMIKNKFADGQQIFIDGITVEYPDYWFNLRTSNTEALIRFTIEAKDFETMQKKRDEIIALLQ